MVDWLAGMNGYLFHFNLLRRTNYLPSNVLFQMNNNLPDNARFQGGLINVFFNGPAVNFKAPGGFDI